MKKIFLRIPLLLLALQILTNCSKDDKPEPDMPEPEPEKGYVTGKVVDTKGKPLSGVEIVIDNTYLYNSNLVGATDEEGNYKIKLSAGTFFAYAEFRKNYNGKTYEIELHPETNEGFAQDGALRNFQWKMTGKKPGTSSDYYGGMIELNSAIGSMIADPENIEFTLTPVGVLIDGSEGSVIKMKPGQPRTDSYSKLLDIPIGKYKITAHYQGELGDFPLKLRNDSDSNSSFANTLEFDFEPQTSFCFDCAVIEYME